MHPNVLYANIASYLIVNLINNLEQKIHYHHFKALQSYTIIGI